MANRFKMALSETIRRLHGQGWSRRRIARELVVDRETVARHLRRGETAAKPAKAPSGSPPAPKDPKPANAPSGSDPVGEHPKPANAPSGSDPVGEHPKPADAPLGSGA